MNEKPKETEQQKAWRKQKIHVLQEVLQHFQVTTENVKYRCRMEKCKKTKAEKLFVDGKPVITISDQGWVKHYEQNRQRNKRS